MEQGILNRIKEKEFRVTELKRKMDGVKVRYRRFPVKSLCTSDTFTKLCWHHHTWEHVARQHVTGQRDGGT